MSVAVSCLDPGGAATGCAGASVRTVRLAPKGGVVAGESYQVDLHPGAAILAGGEPVVLAEPLLVEAPSVLEDRAVGRAYRWDEVRSSGSYGGRAWREAAPGATATFAFTGTSVTWYTRRGPTEGVATVAIDGRRRRTVDNSSPRVRDRVPVRLDGLSPGRHTVTVRVEGRRGARGRGRTVTVDAFRAGRLVRNPSVSADWGPAHRDGRGWSRAGVGGAEVSLRFRGSQIVWHTLSGPRQGSAAVILDGVRVDTYLGRASSYALRSVVVPAGPGVHRLTVRALDSDRNAPSFVSVDRFEVSQ
ncbi:hypothetical protein [Nocardioides sambongensis]|uniref:hypothetical protein n=1 Tax=Nocardioides sambongensis TaxID=2589074 RepID=UPI0015E84473|nr:hypothetical protein [Nocardioides sambongensis]